MDRQTRDFHLGDVLSITTGRLLSLEGMGGVYKILNHMTNDNLFTHQLGRAANECKPWLLRAHPGLDDASLAPALADLNTRLDGVEGRDLREEIVLHWLAEMAKRFGERLSVEPIPRDDHDFIDPIKEARDRGMGPIVVVEMEDTDD